MPIKKEDRRVKYTKMVLKESFIRLLSIKDLSKITIKEICGDADVNRATFYSHYEDQYDLMRDIENDLFENINAYLSENNINTHKNRDWKNTVDAVEKILDYIKGNAEICKVLLNDRGDLHFQKKLMMLVYNEDIENLVSKGKITQSEAEYIYSFMLMGCVGFLQKWFDNAMEGSSRFMAETLIRLFFTLAESFTSQNTGKF